MTSLWSRFSSEEDGFIISGELILVGTILILGMVVGLAELQFSVTGELQDIAGGFEASNDADVDFESLSPPDDFAGADLLGDTDL